MNIEDIKMTQCNKCYYFFPTEELQGHSAKCINASKMIACPVCNCDYHPDIIERHASRCEGFERKIQFISEHSRRKYSQVSIRKLVKSLEEHSGEIVSGRAILREINEDKFNIDKWVSFDDSPKVTCGTCADDVPADDIFVLECGTHKICYDCLYRYAIVKLNENGALTCPYDKCNVIVHVNELRHLPFPRHVVNKLVTKYDEQLLARAVEKTKGYIKCPKANCKWMAFSDQFERLRIKCGNCQEIFCSMCLKDFHYRTECNDLAKLSQEWTVWCTRGRQSHQKNIQKQQNDVQKFQREKDRVEQRNDELLRNFQQLQQDEQFKMQRCRLCPNCNRVIEKIDGCDSMVCGQNYHGGDIQNGCGHKFNWQQAKPYVSQLQNQPQLERLMLQAPKLAENVNHFPYKCDNCRNDIIGIRFECVHCECINFCESCEAVATSNHPSTHIFKLVCKAQ